MKKQLTLADFTLTNKSHKFDPYTCDFYGEREYELDKMYINCSYSILFNHVLIYTAFGERVLWDKTDKLTKSKKIISPKRLENRINNLCEKAAKKLENYMDLCDLISETPTTAKMCRYCYNFVCSNTLLYDYFYAESDTAARMAVKILSQGRETPVSLCRVDPQTARILEIVWHRKPSSSHRKLTPTRNA